MAEELEPVRQNIEINVTDKGADEATSDLTKLNTTITASTTATTANTKEVKKSEDQFKSYKQQLKEATIAQQKLAQQYGATSTQAIDAAKKVATITDEMQFQKDLAKSYNPDEKFRALSQTAGLATLALGGVKDGLAALGIENKTLDKIIGSAQAILGVTSAVSGITDAYELLTAAKKAKTAAEVVEIGTTEALTVAEGEATVATWSFNAALLANPIVAITAGIVAAIAVIYTFIKVTGDAADTEERANVAALQLNNAIDAQSKAFDNNSKFTEANNNHKLALLKASGASETAIYKETVALKNQENALAQINLRQAERLKEQAYQLDKANSTDATKEALKKATENEQKAFDILKKGFDDQDKIRNDHEIAVVQAETEARNKAIAEEKAHQEELKRIKKQAAADALKAHQDELKKINDVSEENASFIEKTKQSQEDVKKEKEAKAEEDRKLLLANQLQETSDNAEGNKRALQAEADFKESINDRAKDNAEKLLAFAASGAIKNKQIQKAAIITESGVNIGKTVSNTATAIGQDLKLGFPANIAPIALDVGMGAASMASILSGTKTALQAVGGGSAPSASAGGVPAPTRNVAQVGFQGSSENQISSAIAKQQKDQPPIQAFVVSQSVTDAQELQRKKELTNSF